MSKTVCVMQTFRNGSIVPRGSIMRVGFTIKKVVLFLVLLFGVCCVFLGNGA